MIRQRLFVMIVVVAALFAPGVWAQGEVPVVRVVMLYSPTCPHCHDIITTVLPPLEEQYGDQIDVMLINADTYEGNVLFWDVMDALAIPEEDQGVPVIVVGNTLLIGGEHSTARLPEVVAKAMERGGADWPDLPGLEAFVAQHDTGNDDQPLTVADMTIGERLALDPLGSTVALVVLGLLTASVLLVGDAWRRAGLDADDAGGRSTLVVPLLAVLGLIVAAYLAYVELTDTSAVCGPVGRCNLVQQSPYARLFGVLPIGVLGVVGYVLILGLWAWQRVSSGGLARRGRWILPVVVLFGVLFSIYLTFLEPFVIGAVCMWCVTSAVVMMALLWATAPREAVASVVPLRRGADESPARVDEAPVDDEPAPEADVPVERTMKQRVLLVLGYVLAAIVGVIVTALVVHYAKGWFPPPTISTITEANRRAGIENAVMVAGLVIGPAVWHAVRAARRKP